MTESRNAAETLDGDGRMKEDRFECINGKGCLFTFLFAAVLAFAFPLTTACLAEAEDEEEAGLSEWTIMFYFCGSDLESKHGYATGNLEEILQCIPFDAIGANSSDDGASETIAVPNVNVVLQTGGSNA